MTLAPSEHPERPVGGWIDTHCHVHDDKMSAPASETLMRAREAGVTAFIAIGTDARTCAEVTSLAAAHDDVWATVGLHPHDAIEGVDTISSFVTAPRVVAIGECGLDYHYDHSPRPVQMRVFAEQIRLAHEHGLSLVVHTRDAWDDTLDVLATEGVPDATIIHCFTGGPAEAERCLDIGAYLSFSGIVTFKNAADIREAAVACPADRILVETDSPYLSPVPFRGRPNEPAHVGIVGTAIATWRGDDPAEFARITTANARRAFPAIPSGA